MSKEKKLYMIGNAHIDLVWLWQWQEGFQEIKATFRSVLDRMNEYDDFVFTGSSACFYEWIEENEAAMFEEIKKRIQEGRWIIAGGWWVQPDCNAPCPESFVRQGVYGQKYFEDKFGVKAVCGYNVDSFGHNGMLPQILQKCGMKNYVFMRPGRHEKGLPGETFLWKSIDGSQVTASRIPFEYCTWPEQIEEHIKRCAGEIKNPENGIMCFYGVGNHGGGPTIQNIDSIKELNKKTDMPELLLTSPDDFFRDVKKNADRLPVVCGELFHHSSGCYSAHSEVKSLNRKSENRLLAAEKISVMADLYLSRKYPLADYTEAWKNVLFNQFHDILAGTSIEAAYSDARERYGAALHVGAQKLNAAIQALSWHIDIKMEEGMKPLVVFNPNSFAMISEVEIESVSLKENTVLLDESGNQVAYQMIQSQASCNGRCRLVFAADLPSLGYRTYRFVQKENGRKFTDVAATDTTAENKWFKIAFDPESGYITSFFQKNDNTEYFSAPAAVPVVIEDKSDTWSHGVRIFNQEAGRFKAVSVRKIENGPVKAVIRVTSEYGKSRILEDYSIYKEISRIDVRTTVDWHEKRKMLKLQFPMNMNYLRCSWEIPFGCALREPDGTEYPMQGFLDVEGTNPGMETHMNGLSILSDGIFAGSIDGKTVSLTILRSPIYAQHEPYEPDENLEYTYIDQGVRSFTYALYPHEGSWENANTLMHAKNINQRPIALFETYHKGELAQSASLLNCSPSNVMVETVKEAEDGSGDIVIRAYETAGRQTEAAIQIPVLSRMVKAAFMPFEIKTFRIPRDKSKNVVFTNMLEDSGDESL